MKKPKLARLLRPSPPESFARNVVATYDEENNIVRYRKDIYDLLEPIDQARVRNLRDEYLELATAEPSYFNK